MADRRPLRRKQGLVLSMFGCCLLGMELSATSTGQLHFDAIGIAVLMVAFLIMGCGSVLRWKNRLSFDDVIRSTGFIDWIQGQYFQAFRRFPIFILVFIPISFRSSYIMETQSVDSKIFIHVLVLLGYLGILMLYLQMLTNWHLPMKIRNVVSDELFQRNQSYGMRTGFIVAFLSLIFCFCLGIFKPMWGIAMIPSAIGVSVAAAGLRFAQLGQRDELDD